MHGWRKCPSQRQRSWIPQGCRAPTGMLFLTFAQGLGATLRPCSATLLGHAVQTCCFLLSARQELRKGILSQLHSRWTQALRMQDLSLWKCPHCCRAGTPALALPWSSVVCVFPAGEKVHPPRHFIVVPAKKSPWVSHSRAAPALQEPSLVSQPVLVPVPACHGSSNDSFLFRRLLHHPEGNAF